MPKVAPERWLPYKSLIQEKYLVKKQTLPEIMKYMEEKEGFSASKSAYERQLKVWGCHKNATDAIWKFLRLRLQERETEGRRSDVYFYGNLIDEARVQHRVVRAHTTFVESRIALRPTTPDNVAIIPPISSLYLHSIKGDRLPWQQFCELVESQVGLNIAIQLPGDMRRTMAPYLVPEPISTSDVSIITKRIVEYLNAILPLDHDQEIFDHLKLAFADPSQRSTWEFLKLTVYLLSNKLLLEDELPHRRFESGAKTISDEILKWFQIGNNRMFCHAILAIKVPSIEAFAEIIFRSAVTNEAVSMVRMLLEFGIDPNTFVEHEFDSLTPLQFAAIMGNVDMTKILLEYGANTQARDTRATLMCTLSYLAFPQTPLQIAARMGNLKLVKLLISAGASVNTDESFWSSALQNAAKGRHYEIMQLLLNAQADINASYGIYGCAMACAIEERCEPLVNLMLENNADVNSSGPSGITPLQAAAMVNDEAMVSYMLKREAKVNTPIPTKSSWAGEIRTPLQWAVKNGNKKIVSLLLNAGEDLNRAIVREDDGVTCVVGYDCGSYTSYVCDKGYIPNRRGNTALEVAVEEKNKDMISALLDAGADPSKDCSMSFAIDACDVELMDVLLQRGANVNNLNHNIPPALYQAVKAKNLEMVQFLLSRGADPNIDPERGNHNWRTLLQLATQLKSMEIIKALVYGGAKCNEARGPGHPLNPLQIAADIGDLELVKYFIAAKADVNWPASNQYGRTAFQQATEEGHMNIVKFLLSVGADINAPAAGSYGVTALQAAISRNHLELVDFLLEHGADPDDQPSSTGGLSALQRAAKTGNDELVLKLVAAGAKVNGSLADNGGLSAIQAAALNGHITTIQLLLQLGADVNAPGCSENGYTALQAAVSKGHLKTTELLLERGADVNAPSSHSRFERYYEGGSALVLAARNGYIRIAKLLLARGASLIEEGAMLALCEAARNGRIDMMKLLITRALESREINRNHLKMALDAANDAGHTAAAKFLECHKVVVTSSCRLGVQNDDRQLMN